MRRRYKYGGVLKDGRRRAIARLTTYFLSHYGDLSCEKYNSLLLAGWSIWVSVHISFPSISLLICNSELGIRCEALHEKKSIHMILIKSIVI